MTELTKLWLLNKKTERVSSRINVCYSPRKYHIYYVMTSASMKDSVNIKHHGEVKQSTLHPSLPKCCTRFPAISFKGRGAAVLCPLPLPGGKNTDGITTAPALKHFRKGLSALKIILSEAWCIKYLKPSGTINFINLTSTECSCYDTQTRDKGGMIFKGNSGHN